jgi:hypothetical protein
MDPRTGIICPGCQRRGVPHEGQCPHAIIARRPIPASMPAPVAGGGEGNGDGD